MLYSNTLDAQLPVFQALSSETRVQIMNLILEKNGINLKQLASELKISISTLSPHIARLSDCGLIRLEDVPASHGTQKCCYPCIDQILINFDARSNVSHVIQEEIPIGHYSDFQITAPCGLSGSTAFLGKLDLPRSFARLDHYHAGILWFGTGYLEYILPNPIPIDSRIDQFSLSFEICSEAPNYNNDWPSDIEFSLNGTVLGVWTSPGDFGDRRGDLNPSWWYSFLNQYGILKNLTINSEGTWLDNEKLSSVTIEQLQLTPESVLKFRFTVHADRENARGFTLFGHGFGDHNQDLRMCIEYTVPE